MSDDRLFASNNAIGRKWYYINIVILCLIALATDFLFKNYVIPNARTDSYILIAKGIMYFAYLIYLITFFALIDRRLYDMCGSRETTVYKNISSLLKIIVFVHFFTLYCTWKKPQLPIALNDLTAITIFLDFIFFICIFIIGLFRGKITNLTYDEYRKKTRYE